MAFIKVALDAQEPEVAPDADYDLRIVKCEEAKSGEKAKIPGEPYLKVMIVIEEPGVEYLPIWHNIMIPTKKTSEDNVPRYKLGIQRFLSVFNIPGDADGFDTDDFLGATGRCAVVQTENDQTGEPRNELRLPRLRD